jgi:broad specificity phosphatase PhoE
MKPLLPAVRRLAFVLLLGPVWLPAPASSDDDVLAALPPLPSGALRVYLVRHGQALSNLDPVPDRPPAELDHLTALGTRQAEAVGRALASRGVTSVLTSPASRARETAEGIARALSLAAPAVETQLRPMERGESMERVGDRVDGLVHALARSRRGTSVVLVAHGEVLAAYLGHVQDPSAPKRDPKGLATGSITVVDVAPTGAATIRLENHVPRGPEPPERPRP